MRLLRVKVIGGLLIAGLIAGLSMGAVAEEGTEIVYAFMGSPTELTAEENAVELFSKAFPDIKVTLMHVIGGYEQKILTMAAAGLTPDVMVQGALLSYAHELFLPLDSLIESDLDKSVYLYPKLFFVESGGLRLEGKGYLLPKTFGGLTVIVYNEKIFDEAGLGYPSEPYPRRLTVEEFAELGRKIAKDVDGDGRTDIFGSDPLYYGIVHRWFGVEQTGIVYKDGKWVCTWDSPEALASIKFLYNGMYEEKWALPWGENRVQQFVTDKVGMLTDFGWYLRGELDKIAGLRWDLSARPGKPDILRGGSGASGIAISRTTKHPDAAWKLAKFLSTDIRAQTAYHYAFPIGVTKEAAEKFMDVEHPKYLGYMIYRVEKEAEIAPPWPVLPKRLGEIMALFWNEIKNLYEGRDTPESLCKRVTEEANKILEEEREWEE